MTVLNFGQISVNISKTVQDRDILSSPNVSIRGPVWRDFLLAVLKDLFLYLFIRIVNSSLLCPTVLLNSFMSKS